MIQSKIFLLPRSRGFQLRKPGHQKALGREQRGGLVLIFLINGLKSSGPCSILLPIRLFESNDSLLGIDPGIMPAKFSELAFAFESIPEGKFVIIFYLLRNHRPIPIPGFENQVIVETGIAGRLQKLTVLKRIRFIISNISLADKIDYRTVIPGKILCDLLAALR